MSKDAATSGDIPDPPESLGQGPIIRAACIQMRGGLSRQANINDAVHLIEMAARDGATLISTPEMTNVVDRKPARLLADLPTEENLDEIEVFAETAHRLGVWLHAGSFAVRMPGPGQPPKAANRAFLFAPDGRVTARYDKLHMFDVSLPHGETWRESALFEPGNQLATPHMGAARLGLSICYDVRFPALYRHMAQDGADIFCIPAAFTRQTGRAHWSVLLRARAIECGAFVLAAAQGGDHEDGRETWGHSMIIDPWGTVLASLDHDAPGHVVADLDLREVATARQRIPNLTLSHPALSGA
ncbi:MAG: carbon-nitrogen hydrolase family protein [Pseudomonadota bacterium]